MKRLTLFLLLMLVGFQAKAQLTDAPKIGDEPKGHVIERQPDTSNYAKIELALEAIQKVPFIDWGSWNYVTIHGTIAHGVIEKVHPWDTTCRGFQPVKNGKPRDIYLTCKGYCYYGLPTPHKGHPLYIYDIRLTCDEFGIFERAYAPKTDLLRNF